MKNHSHIMQSLFISCIIIAVAIFLTPHHHTTLARQPEKKIAAATDTPEPTKQAMPLKNSFKEQVLLSPEPVVVYFSATWCPSCQQMKPIFNEVAHLIPNVRFIIIDVDEWEELSDSYNIQSIPALLFFNKGVLVKRLTKVLTKDQLTGMVHNLFLAQSK